MTEKFKKSENMSGVTLEKIIEMAQANPEIDGIVFSPQLYDRMFGVQNEVIDSNAAPKKDDERRFSITRHRVLSGNAVIFLCAGEYFSMHKFDD